MQQITRRLNTWIRIAFIFGLLFYISIPSIDGLSSFNSAKGYKQGNTFLSSVNCSIGYNYCMNKRAYQTNYKALLDSAQAVEYIRKNKTFRFTPLHLAYRGAQSWVNYEELNNVQSQSGSAMLEDSKVIYPNVFYKGINLTYNHTPSQLKEILVLKNSTVLPKPSGWLCQEKNCKIYLELYELISYDSDVSLWINGVEYDGKSSITTGGQVEFKDGNGNPLYYIPRPYAYDSVGERINLNITLLYKNKKTYLYWQLPYSWLNSSKRVYPIYIDPTIQIGTPGLQAIAVVPLSDNDFVMAYCNSTGTDTIGFLVYNTNGSRLNSGIVDSNSVDCALNNMVVSVDAFNSEEFVIAYAEDNGLSDGNYFAVYNKNGTLISSSEIAWVSDYNYNRLDINVLDNSSFVVNYVEDDEDTYFKVYNKSGTLITDQTYIDPGYAGGTRVTSSASIVDTSSFITGSYSDHTDPVKLRFFNKDGTTFQSYQTVYDYSNAPFGDTAVLSSNTLVIIYFDSNSDLVIRTRYFNGTDINSTVLSDTVSKCPEVEKINNTSFLLLYERSTDFVLKRYSHHLNALFSYSFPGIVTSGLGRAITPIGFCGNDKFVVAWSNSTGSYWRTYYINGSVWNGVCPVANTAPNITSPVFNETTIYSVTNVNVSTNYTDADGDNGTIYFKCYVNGSNTYNRTISNVLNNSSPSFVWDSGNYSVNDLINCSVYANDGTANSTTLWSTTNTVQAQSFSRSTFQALSLTESSSKSTIFTQSPIDSFIVVDDSARESNLMRGHTDSFSIIEQSGRASRIALLVRVASQAFSLADLVYVPSTPKNILIALTFSDSATNLFKFARTPSQSLTLYEVLLINSVFNRGLTNLITISELASVVNGIERTGMDSISFGELLSRMGLFDKHNTQSISLYEALQRQGVFQRGLNDAVSTTEISDIIATMQRDYTDSITYVDALTQLGLFERNPITQLTLNEYNITDINRIRLPTLSLSMIETLDVLLTMIKKPSQSLTILESMSKGGGIYRVARDSLSFLKYSSYDFKDITDNKAYNNSVQNKPPTSLSPVGEQEFNTYAGINASDNTYFTTNPSSTTIKPYHKFNITINEKVGNIKSINISWEGHTLAGDTASLYVYNHSANSWGTALASGSGATDFWLNYTITSGFSDIINNGVISVLVQDPSSWCYQESANVSTACGGLNSGLYKFYTLEGSEVLDKEYFYDGDWNTYIVAPVYSLNEIYINYTTPSNAISALWQIHSDNTSLNITTNNSILPSCWSNNTIELKIIMNRQSAPSGNLSYRCWNTTGWQVILEYPYSSHYIFEEAMYWNISTPSNLSTDYIKVVVTSELAEANSQRTVPKLLSLAFALSSDATRLSKLSTLITAFLSLVDTTNRELKLDRALTQPLSIADIAKRIGEYFYSMIAKTTVLFTDMVVRSTELFKSPSLVLGISDSPIKIRSIPRESNQAFFFLDSSSVLFAFARSPIQPISLSDVVDMTYVFTKSLSSTITLSGLVDLTHGIERTGMDSISFGELLSRMGLFDKHNTQSISLYEALQRQGVFQRGLNDAVSTTEISDIIATMQRDYTDSITYVDALTQLGLFERNPSTSIVVGGTAIRLTGITRLPLQILTFIDTTGALVNDLAREVIQTISYSDLATRLSKASISQILGLTLSDSATNMHQISRNIAEGIQFILTFGGKLRYTPVYTCTIGVDCPNDISPEGGIGNYDNYIRAYLEDHPEQYAGEVVPLESVFPSTIHIVGKELPLPSWMSQIAYNFKWLFNKRNFPTTLFIFGFLLFVTNSVWAIKRRVNNIEKKGGVRYV